MYINIDDVEKFKKALYQGKAEYEELTGEKGGSVIDITPDETGEIIVEEDEITVNISNEIGYFTISFPTENITEDILRVAIKKMNRIKTMIETLK